MSVRAIIAEDESLLRVEMSELLATVWPDLDIVALAEDGVKAARKPSRSTGRMCCFRTSRCPECRGWRSRA